MAKVQITEEKLNRIIQESMAEVLAEAQEDEGLGGFLGRLGQGIRNKVNHFKQDYNLGRNYARYRAKDYNPGDSDNGGDSYYAKKGVNPNDFMNFGGDQFGRYRKDYMGSVRDNAANSWEDQYGNVTLRNKPQVQPQGQPQGNETPGGPVQNGQVTTRQNNMPKGNFQQQLNNLAAKLQKSGFILNNNGRWVAANNPNWEATNDKQLDNRIQSWAIEYYNLKKKRNLEEMRRRRMNKIISESVQKAIRETLHK